MTIDHSAVSPDASFWAAREQVYVTVYHGDSLENVWPTYLAGLQACYRDFGIAHISTDELVRLDDCSMLWLVHDSEWNAIGGFRAVGPLHEPDEVDRLAAVGELGGSPSLNRFTDTLRDLATDGLVEIKGAWSAPGVKGLGAIMGSFGWFCTWWFGVGHTVCTAGAENNLDRWVESGAYRYEWFAPVHGYPSDAYHTEPVVWSLDRMDRMTDRYRDLLETMTRHLHSARARYHSGRKGPEVIFRPERIAYLAERGARMIDHSGELVEQASELESPVAVGDDRSHPWIHFPWSNTAVRLIDPVPFHALRTDRNRYKLTSEEMTTLRGKKVGVVGLSVGGAIAYTLAQEGLCGELRIADFDTIELSNLNRLAGSVTELGMNKAELAARRIHELDPFLDVRIHPDGVTPETIAGFLEGLDLVIEECDSLDVKVLVREHAARLGIPVIMETNDRGLLDIERFDLEPDRPPFHGLVESIRAADLAGLSTDDKVPFVLDILEAGEISDVFAATLVEIDESVSSWPQLASDVALGAALACHAVRKVLLGRQHQRSGRVRVDLDRLYGELRDPEVDRRDATPPLVVRDDLPSEFSEAVLTAAGMAPSGGNAQPWRFALDDAGFSVFEKRDGIGMDIKGRGTAVACGAALFNARCIAASHRRLADPEGSVDLTLDLDQPELVGRLGFGNQSNTALAALATAIRGRVTNRRLDASAVRIEPADLDHLSELAALDGARLIHVPAAELQPLADIWADSDRIRLLNESLHAEMFDELRRPGYEPLDRGLDQRTLELSPIDEAKLDILRRGDVMRRLDGWNRGHRLREDALDRLAGSAAMLIVTVDGGTRADYVRGGMALQRMWLGATGLELQLQPVSPVFGYARESEELLQLLGPERGRECDDLRRKAWAMIGLADDEVFVLAMRAHYGPRPTAISERLSIDRVRIEQRAPAG